MRMITFLVLFSILFSSILYVPTVSAATFTVQWSVNRNLYGWNPTTGGIVSADVIPNGDGVLELFTAGQYYIGCFRGSDGELLWRYNYTNEDAHLLMSIDDIDNDGGFELLVYAYNEVLCFNAESGGSGPIWTYQLPYPQNRLDKSSAVVDVDHTGYKYIFLAAQGYNGAPTTVKLNWLGQTVAQNNFDAYTCWGGLAAADLDGDGIVEIVQGHRRAQPGVPGYTAWGGVTCMEATDLSMKWNVNYIACSSHPPSIADVNGDGILDVIVIYQGANDHRGFWVISGDDGHIIHGQNDSGINAWFDMAVYDIDGDGHIEAISSFQQSEDNSTPNPSTVFDLTTWQIEATLPHKMHWSPAIGNVDGDPDMEIICFSPSGLDSQGIAIYKYNNGAYEVLYESFYQGLWCGISDVAVLDVDGDGLNEMIRTSGGLYDIVCYQTEGVASSLQPRASCSLSNERRTKVSEYVPPPGEEPETPKTIKIISPNGGETWTKGSTQTIFWSYTGNISNVKIELYKNGTYNSTINTSTVNNGSFSWTITQNVGTTYKIRITDTSNTTVWDESNNYFSIVDTSNPPYSPTINGPVSGKINVQHNYTLNAVDPDEDDVYYYIDWGDVTHSGWVGPFASGIDIIVNHTWTEKGTYKITAKAKDINDLESPSTTLDVTMPKEMSINSLFFWFLDLFPYAFPILRHLLGY